MCKWVVIITVVLTGVVGNVQGKYGGGTGEPNDPYQIWDANHMQAIGADTNDWDKCFVLMADIDLGQFTGTEFNIIGDATAFTGVFDGNNHTISNFTWHSTDRNDAGLFAWVDGGEIRNLGLIDPNVIGENALWDVGALVGYLGWTEGGTITNCYVRGGYVRGEDSVGGLCGFSDHGIINDCYVEGGSLKGVENVGGLCGWNNYGTINSCYATISVNGDAYLGGLCGRMQIGTISNCYAKGAVTGGDNSDCLGGLCGVAVGETISQCFSTGPVIGYSNVGGLCGGSSAIVHLSFWDVQTSDVNSSACGVGKTTSEMMNVNTYTGWGDNIWTIDSGYDYPHLLWENQSGIPIIDITRTYSGGSGTVNKPYLIAEANDLITLGIYSVDWDKHFKLINDIDLSGLNFDTRLIPIFSGFLDGNGYTIRNLTIGYLGSSGQSVGLIGRISSENAQVQNLGLTNVSITGGMDSRSFGSLCGTNYGKINKCYANGLISVWTDSWFLGGLCGYNSGTVSNCYAIVSVNGADNSLHLGGSVGGNFGEINNCYSIGLVTGGVGSTYLGGLSGSNSGNINNCFLDIEIGGPDNGIGTPLTTEQMQTASTFTSAGWDFTNESANGTDDIWRMCVDDVQYPRLSLEYSMNSDFVCPDGVEFFDFSILAQAWQSIPADDNWDSNCDLDGDEHIGAGDLAIACGQWLEGM